MQNKCCLKPYMLFVAAVIVKVVVAAGTFFAVVVNVIAFTAVALVLKLAKRKGKNKINITKFSSMGANIKKHTCQYF